MSAWVGMVASSSGTPRLSESSKTSLMVEAPRTGADPTKDHLWTVFRAPPVYAEKTFDLPTASLPNPSHPQVAPAPSTPFPQLDRRR